MKVQGPESGIVPLVGKVKGPVFIHARDGIVRRGFRSLKQDPAI
jgi:hypothetical protein